MSTISSLIFRNRTFKFVRKYVEKHSLNNIIAPLLDFRKIGVVYDIGARRGDWSMGLQKILPSADYFLFDSSNKYEKTVRKNFKNFYVETLSNSVREVDFYSNNSTGDSYYLEDSTFFSGVQPKKVRTVTLDDLVKTHSLPPPDFIKIDTQGSELDILRGGLSALQVCAYVLLEVPLIPLNIGAPGTSEILDFMRGQDFYPHEITEFHRNKSSSRLGQVDILFLSSRHFGKFL